MIQKPAPAPNAPKPAKRSILGMLFNPQLGPAISPLRDSTKIFVHLLAAVFAIYGLFPKDHPALKDQNAPLSLFQVMGIAWQRVEFSRDGLPRAIMFFAVLVMIAVSFIGVITVFLSFFIGHAHAQAALNADSFTAPNPSKDLAYNWLEYLFNPSNPALVTGQDSYGSGEVVASMQDPFQGSRAIQSALMAGLNFYSQAILIVAALILFYHLAAMVVETAHHGVPMGKRASQIWAPIRLVFAIGLLVPINGGLSSGQFIVVKVAELGSGLAGNVWSTFLQQLANYNTTFIPPGTPIITNIVNNMIHMEACMLAWNQEISNQVNNPNGGLDSSVGNQLSMNTSLANVPAHLGNVSGQKYYYPFNSSSAMGDTDICGYFFIPNGSGVTPPVYQTLVQNAAGQQATVAQNQMTGAIHTAAMDIVPLVSTSAGNAQAATATPLQYNEHVKQAVAAYQQALNQAFQNTPNSYGQPVQDAVNNITPYGWVMAGAFLNAIDRMQADVSGSVDDTMPRTEGPTFNMGYSLDQSVLSIRDNVQQDLGSFNVFTAHAMANYDADAQTASCAAMVGMSPGNSTSIIEHGGSEILAFIDNIGLTRHLWASPAGVSCGAAGGGNSTFTLGIQFGGRDPFAQMAYLGHAHIDAAIDLAEAGMLASAVSAATKGYGEGVSDKAKADYNSKMNTKGSIINIGANIGEGAATVFFFLALLLWVSGFTLAFLVPLMPFMRFMFAALSWVAGVIEAVVAVPLIALAHLNPEGEGLPGQQARTAYFFLFNLFVRPVMTVFGLLCGLILFLIGISFLNYGYVIAVSGASGMDGKEGLEHLIFSILYVAIAYVLANHSFQLIDHIPQHAMSWFGGQAQQFPQMGNVDKIEGIGTAISGYVTQQGMIKAQQAAASVGGIIGNASKIPSQNAGLSRAAEKDATDRDSARDRTAREIEDNQNLRKLAGAPQPRLGGSGSGGSAGGAGGGRAAPILPPGGGGGPPK